MKVRAHIKYLRTSAKKVKEIAGEVMDMNPERAIEKLEASGKKGAIFLARVVKSALANATNNMKLDPSLLHIKSIKVEKGPAFKRWRAVGKGMAHSILKRTSHIEVILEAEDSKN